MNDKIATDTLNDHKYLLQEVQNRAAIAYFAAANRNLSLYIALKNYCNEEDDGRVKTQSTKGENKKNEDKIKPE